MSKGTPAATSLMDALLKDNVRKRKQDKKPAAAAPVHGPVGNNVAINWPAILASPIYYRDPQHGFVQIGWVRDMTVTASVGSMMEVDMRIVVGGRP